MHVPNNAVREGSGKAVSKAPTMSSRSIGSNGLVTYAFATASPASTSDAEALEESIAIGTGPVDGSVTQSADHLQPVGLGQHHV